MRRSGTGRSAAARGATGHGATGHSALVHGALLVALVAVLAGCTTQDAPGDGGTDPAASPSAEPSEPTATETATGPTTEPPAGSPEPADPDAQWPPASQALQHGAQVWAAYVAVADSPEDPVVAAASERLEEVGYGDGLGAGELGCDQGAAEGLGVDETYGLGVYFDTQADAETFAELWGPDVVGTAQVTLFCMD